MGISFEEYCGNLGNPTFLLPEELGDIIFFVGDFRNTSALEISWLCRRIVHLTGDVTVRSGTWYADGTLRNR